MDRIKPKETPLRPDGTPMTEEDLQAIRDQITAFDDIEWIKDRPEIVERFMRDLVSRLLAKRTETFQQAFGRMRAKGEAEGHGKDRPKRKSARNR